MRDDPLAGIRGWQKRRLREQEDAKYLASRQDAIALVSSREGLKNDSATYAGIGLVARDLGVKPWDGTTCAVGIGARVDLDHPIYFPDNVFTDCADCGCGLQHRPQAPRAKEWLCICCAARRVRESLP
jgi:hypothetical protein